ncbi:S8 family serine peptidase [Cyclobacterium plantarum]|uniref:S8 family serine peptidase n=1 Tax=Cyclobacterium plantarum TaxID=2716263 RepID=A0ABX0HCY0_9BACT|nr:S8 family serine peptidase [Cyclobacterium plantarum]NHE59744.1 S8 family serine peptidase [Cyclobacterium plantarum]
MDPYTSFQVPTGDRPKYTGKKLVMLSPDASMKNIDAEASGAALRLAPSSAYKSHEEDYIKAFEEGDGIVFEKFRIAVINANHEEQIKSLLYARRSFQYEEPERYLYALDGPRSSNFGVLLWQMLCRLFGIKKDPPEIDPDPAPKDPLPESPPVFENTGEAYWGLHALDTLANSFTGKGVKLAVLDTGMYLAHPDFASRQMVTKSFIRGESVDDINGHGTHCAGIAVGGTRGESGIRYGTASEANLYVGKVLSNAGVGSDSGILAGMEWAVEEGCRVISMSLGASVEEDSNYSNIYNELAGMAMDMGTLIIGAAGNDSRRSQGRISAVNHPANCPNILAVGALDRRSEIADFSCGGLNPNGGLVDIAGPGVEVFSSWKTPQEYAILSGTSMATPFVAGVAAQLLEAFPEATAREVWDKLVDQARPLPLPVRDVGAGLVQSPK